MRSPDGSTAAVAPAGSGSDGGVAFMVVTNQAQQRGTGDRRRSAGARDVRGERMWKLVAVAAMLLLVGFIAYVAARPRTPRPVAYPVTPPATLAVGSAAPAFVLPRLGGGQPVTLASVRGTPTVVNFFASWCRDCQAELAAFAAFSTHASGRVAIVGVDSNDSDTASAERMLTSTGATYPVGVDSDARVATSYLLSALPVTYFLDRDGRVVHAAFGPQTLSSLEHWEQVLVK
jgi:cytochrome c biogenesis protein CcmG, thiol:disulfide interchange protein DsbE